MKKNVVTTPELPVSRNIAKYKNSATTILKIKVINLIIIKINSDFMYAYKWFHQIATIMLA